MACSSSRSSSTSPPAPRSAGSDRARRTPGLARASGGPLPCTAPMARDPAIHCSPEEGAAWRDGVYRPIDADALPPAPRGPAFPDPGHGPPLRRLDDVPRVPRLRDVVGPSVIALGM